MKSRFSLYWGTCLILQFIVAISILFVAMSKNYGIASALTSESKLFAIISNVEHPTKVTEDLKVFVMASSKIFIALQSYLVGVGVLLLLLVTLQTILLWKSRNAGV